MAAALALAAPALAADEAPVPTQAPAETTPATAYVPGQIIVVWEEDASHGEKAEAREGAEVEAAADLGDAGYQLVEVEAGQSTAGALAELRSDPAVESAERNALLTPTATVDDPLFNQQWALKNNGPPGVNGFTNALKEKDISATAAWDFFNPLPQLQLGAVVADIDSGYRFSGEELGSVAWDNPLEMNGEPGVDDDNDGIVDDLHGADFVGADWEHPAQDGDPTDDNVISGGHGVHTAGIIGAAGDNGKGIAGVGFAGNARIMPLRVCTNAASPPAPALPNSLTCPASSIISAIKYAGAHGARVANISLTSTSKSEAMAKALGEAKETLFVIAAGNDTKNNDTTGQAHYPCNYQPEKEGTGPVDNIVCVAATNQRDELASFSDWGPTSVDLGAPGTEILSTYPLEAVIDENFQESDAEFNSIWSGNFGRTEGAPLTSSGMSDSPEEAPLAGSTRETELTTPVAIPAGYGNCVFSGRRFLALNGGSFTQEVLRNGVALLEKEITANTTGSSMVPFTAEPTLTNLAGSNVSLRFKYNAGPAPTPTSGVWLDDLALTCYQATNVEPGYAFLQGTSMAAPQVSGTAALMFSLQPAATVKSVRDKLLATVDPAATLSGKTVTGGRLDAAAALAALDITPPGVPALTGTDPTSPNESASPRILGSETDPTATVRIYANGACSGSPQWSGSAAQLASPGIAVTVAHEATVQFSANAIDPAKNVSGCSTPTPLSYKQEDDKVAPEKPQLTATNPTSPNASGTPGILGVAEAKSTVRIYTNETCAGAAMATASAEALLSPGIPVSVPSASTVTFWATATDAAGNTSLCSAPISYTNSSLIETIVTPPNPEPPVKDTSCTVPRVVGKTLAQAKGALGRALCKVGKVTKPKAKPGKKVALVVKSSTPAAGTKAADGVVALVLGPKPRARRR